MCELSKARCICTTAASGRYVNCQAYVYSTKSHPYIQPTRGEVFLPRGLPRGNAATREHRERVITLYAGKFNVTGPNAPAPIARALARVNWYEITLNEVMLIDNSRGLGHRETINIGALGQL